MDDEIPSYNPYNFIKVFTTIFLPGAASVYFVCWLIWDIPAPTMIIGILALITLFFGFILHSGSQGHDGQIVIKKDLEGKKTFLLELNRDPDRLELMDIVRFKVIGDPTPGYDDLAD